METDRSAEAEDVSQDDEVFSQEQDQPSSDAEASQSQALPLGVGAARIENVGKYQSCMVSKLRIILCSHGERTGGM